MHKRVLYPFIFLVSAVLIVGFVCGPGTSTAVAPTQASQGGGGGGGGGGAVNNVQDVQKATIQIEAEGTFEDPQEGTVYNAAGRGSGFIIDPSGIAVTNNHVVTGAALIKVWVSGESDSRNARILGVSECSDLAVIKIEGSGFSYLDWYNQDPKVGLEVYTAGFPLGEPEYSLTKGIISKEKADGQTSWASLDHVLGHDATINPGNSGGPLVTSDGKVVGVNYAAFKSADQYFAIDASTAKSLIDQLKTGTDIDSIGINGTAFVAEDGSISGIWISSVKSGSPADKTGMKAGDILLQMEGLVLATDGTMKDYCSILRTHKPTDTLSVKVYRYSTGEVLEGQLNGRTLAVTQSVPGPETATETSTAPEAAAYFTEEFDTTTLPNWSWFLMSGQESDFSLTSGDGYLKFDLENQNVWLYLIYEPYWYRDIILDARAENRGKNSNSVSLICRYGDEGWYEFNIANSGVYNILVYLTADNKYYQLYNGGSTAIRSGKDVNDYTVGCIGNTLTLWINGTEVRTIQDTTYNLRQGLVGISVSSFDVYPIIVEWDYVTVAEPR